MCTLRFKQKSFTKGNVCPGFSYKKDEKERRKKMALIKFYTRPKRIQICKKLRLPTNLIKKGRSDLYENIIQENSSDQGKLFKISKQLLNQSFEVPFSPHVSKSRLANEMANFFVEKISNIRTKFHEYTIQDCQDCAPIMELHSPSFGSFKAITEDETYSIIMNLAKKSCASSALMSSYRS